MVTAHPAQGRGQHVQTFLDDTSLLIVPAFRQELTGRYFSVISVRILDRTDNAQRRGRVINFPG